MQVGLMETTTAATGWSMTAVVVGAVGSPTGQNWIASHFTIDADNLTVVRDGESVSETVPLVSVIGLDQLGVEPSGLVVLEFALVDGRLLVVCVPQPFVDETVALLQRSRSDGDSGKNTEDKQAVAAVMQPDAEVQIAESERLPVAPERATEESTERHEAADVEAPSAVEIPDPPAPGRGNTKAALSREVAELRAYLERFGPAERKALRADVERLVAHRAEVLAEVRSATLARREQEATLVRVRREAVLQDVGLYQPRHPAESNEGRAAHLAELRERIGAMATGGEAITATDDWSVNGSKVDGRKVVDDLAKLLLRTYNSEADVLVQSMRPYEVDAAVDRLTVTRETIHQLGASMRIEIVDDYHKLRCEELTLAADDLASREEADRVVQASVSGSGYLYVMSNRGTFGPDVVRIGSTTIGDPAELVSSLDGAALPFRSDLHALVPSSDVAALEDEVRAGLEQRRMNLVDQGCGFYAASPAQVRDLLTLLSVDVPWFTVDAPAEEWHLSENSRHHG